MMAKLPGGLNRRGRAPRACEEDIYYLAAVGYVYHLTLPGWDAKELRRRKVFEQMLETLNERQMELFDEYRLLSVEMDGMMEYAHYCAGLYVAREYPDALEKAQL